ncbi:MAG: aldehyde dehydrogenase family protein [Elusimicrobia bacterium]|nr:aldehyde dehydrogenase family protein [Elusimicrobiota bacterium]
MIVFDDAPLERAVEGAVYGAFANAGQVCVSVERLYVQEGIHDAFVAALAARVKTLRVGVSMDDDIGGITDPRARSSSTATSTTLSRRARPSARNAGTRGTSWVPCS